MESKAEGLRAGDRVRVRSRSWDRVFTVAVDACDMRKKYPNLYRVQGWLWTSAIQGARGADYSVTEAVNGSVWLTDVHGKFVDVLSIEAA